MILVFRSIVGPALRPRLASVVLALMGPAQSASATQSSHTGCCDKDARLLTVALLHATRPAVAPVAVTASATPAAPLATSSTAPVVGPAAGVGHRSAGLVIILVLAAGAYLLARVLHRRPRRTVADNPGKPEDQPDLP